MIATVLDQPSPLRAVEHPKSKTVYYGARASNISADPRIAVIDKDNCYTHLTTLYYQAKNWIATKTSFCLIEFSPNILHPFC